MAILTIHRLVSSRRPQFLLRSPTDSSYLIVLTVASETIDLASKYDGRCDAWRKRPSAEATRHNRQFRHKRHSFPRLPGPSFPITIRRIGTSLVIFCVRIGKMNRKLGLLCVAIAILLPPSVGMSQQTIQWEPSLDSAQRLAAQTNRLVLIYFSGPSCVYCRKMEAETLNQPSVASAISADYVAVKVVADHFPATAKRYGITNLPTTVIATPQGQMLTSKPGFVRADEYTGLIGQVAMETKRRREAAYAQIPPGTMAPAVNQPIVNQPPAGQLGQPVLNQPPASQPAWNQPPLTNQPAMAQTPPQGQQSFGPAGSPVAPPIYAPPTNTAPVNGQMPQPIAAPPTMVQQSPAPVIPAPSYGNQVPSGMVSQPPLSAPQNNVAPPAVSGIPALCLDGYCPVSLAEKQQWLPGDRRWGASHRGRTYLFVGPEEQRRFFADPDRYAPVASGNDVVLATEQGQAVSGLREHGVFFGNRVYLFSNEASLEKFSRNPNAYADQALQALRAGAFQQRQQWR